MKNTRSMNRLASLGVAVVLAATAGIMSAQADDTMQPNGGNDGMGPGMMGGHGMEPGMMGGGYGMGMMGMGMMGGGMMGGGMMGGGMMGGGCGMGPGMMSGWGAGPQGFGAGLGLTPAQQAKINKITDETRKSQWEVMGAMMDQHAQLRDLYAAPKPDDAAIGKAYKNFGQLRQKMFDNMVDAQKRIDAVLTKEQREKLHRYWGN